VLPFPAIVAAQGVNDKTTVAETKGPHAGRTSWRHESTRRFFMATPVQSPSMVTVEAMLTAIGELERDAEIKRQITKIGIDLGSVREEIQQNVHDAVSHAVSGL
jgi:hypothetical protein